VEEVFEILADAEALPQWWPSVYLTVTPVGERAYDLYTKGWLPYTLRWQFKVTESRHPHGFTLVATGDFVGRGIWTFEPAGDTVKITYDWKIEAEKPLLKYLSFIMKPIFSANHHWAMRMGLSSLVLELARRQAATDAERAAVPPPPPTTFGWLLPRR